MILVLALAMAFAVHSPIVCGAAMTQGPMPGQLAQVSHPDCHQHSRAHRACCDGMTCISALQAHHDVATPAVSLDSIVTPTLFSYVAPRPPIVRNLLVATAFSPPPATVSLVIRLNTLLI
jgi:hypothetical protein